MDALQVALEVHRDFHVVVCRKALAGGGHGERNINIGHETLLPGESPHREKSASARRYKPSRPRLLSTDQGKRRVQLDFLVPDLLESQPPQLCCIVQWRAVG